LGYLYVEAGDADKALEYNLKALEYDDEDSVTLDNLGQLYYRLLGDKVKAKEYFDKAIEIKPSQMDTRFFLAKYDIEAGKTAEAKETLEDLLTVRPSPLNYATRERIQELLSSIQ
jgi:tetratricopeptide (TPR) repeat protein